MGEDLLINVGASQTGGRIQAVNKGDVTILLRTPACTEKGEKIALSRRIDNHWRLIGWGKVSRGSIKSSFGAETAGQDGRDIGRGRRVVQI